MAPSPRPGLSRFPGSPAGGFSVWGCPYVGAFGSLVSSFEASQVCRPDPHFECTSDCVIYSGGASASRQILSAHANTDKPADVTVFGDGFQAEAAWVDVLYPNRSGQYTYEVSVSMRANGYACCTQSGCGGVGASAGALAWLSKGLTGQACDYPLWSGGIGTTLSEPAIDLFRTDTFVGTHSGPLPLRFALLASVNLSYCALPGAVAQIDSSAVYDVSMLTPGFSFVWASDGLSGSVAVQAPRGGESLLVGTGTPIGWNATGPTSSNVGIDFSPDAGASWTTITSSTPNDGDYDWTVSNAPTTQGLIRVTATNSCNNQPVIGLSGPFSIVTTCESWPCVERYFVPEFGHCVSRPRPCLPCDRDEDCPPCQECNVAGQCEPMFHLCLNTSPCKLRFNIPCTEECFEIDLCDNGFCCKNGECVRDDGESCDPDLLEEILQDAFDYLVNAFLDAGGITLGGDPVGFAYGHVDLPPQAGVMLWEYQLTAAGGARASLSFRDTLLWNQMHPTPPGQWVRGAAWVGDVAGQAGQLVFAFNLGGGLNPGEFRFRDLRVYSRGSPVCLPCDINCDGSVNGFDVEPLIDLLTGGGSRCSPCAGDMDGDGSVNGFDVEPFVAALTGGGC